MRNGPRLVLVVADLKSSVDAVQWATSSYPDATIHTIEVRRRDGGDPAQEIRLRAEELGVDLIVMPCPRRLASTHALVGWLAKQVMHRAHCPVLVVRGTLLSP